MIFLRILSWHSGAETKGSQGNFNQDVIFHIFMAACMMMTASWI